MVNHSRTIGWALSWLFALPLAGAAQSRVDQQGFELGIFRVNPEVKILGAYEENDGSDGDFYGESQAGAKLDNGEARYDLGGFAFYGYRAYDQASELNDDFYGVGGAVASRKSPLKMGLSGQQKKTVDYDVRVDDGSGSDLGAVLTRSASTRTSARFDIGYEKPVAGKGAFLPGYEAWYYNQSLDGAPDIQWQEHTGLLGYGYSLESGILLNLSGSYSIQISDVEDGGIASVSVGAESRNPEEKLSWRALLGVAMVDYEESGADESLEGSLNMQWKATDKLSAYLFGGSSYQPGYAGYGGSSARRVYRAGYGGVWMLLERLSLDAQVLHDRQESIRSGPSDTRHFFSGKIQYDVARRITLALGGSFVKEEVNPDRMIFFCSAVLKY